ncbi:MAG TPA: hypothetical protein EYP33_07875, partial [Pyrodictium sp.]|nr:hypothetical protein [Pyrodictium sp.]
MDESITQKYIAEIKKRLSDAIEDITVKGEDRIYVEVKREQLADAIAEVYWGLGGYLSTMIGTDDRNVDGHYRLFYVFSIE